jgi:hypothetical protein
MNTLPCARRAPVRFAHFLFACFAFNCLGAQSPEEIYLMDLAKAEPGKLPAEFMALNGEFAVRESGGQRFIELPEAPLDTFQLLFGPAQKEGIAASARCWGAKRGRLFPTFAVGLNGQSGHRIQVSPAKAAVELFRGEEVIESKPFTWESDKWVSLKIELVKTGGQEWTVRGKAWTEGAAEPAEWQLIAATKEEPINGRASIWGSPFSGRPIRFDQLKIVRAAGRQ